MKIIKYFIYFIGFLWLLPHISLSKDTNVSPSNTQVTGNYASRFNRTAKTVLSPVYSYLAEYIVNRFKIWDKPGVGIDIGGGPGDLILELCKQTSRFFWINADINTYFSKYLLQSTQENQCEHRIGFLFADVHSMPFRDNYANVIVSRGSLQFWHNREKAFAEIYRILKPGGHAFVGRGFSENMPLEIAKNIRMKLGKKLPKYSPENTANELEEIMKKLKITNYEVLKPKSDQNLVNYGVWVIFTKPETK